MSNEQIRGGYIPAIPEAVLNDCGLDYVELERAPVCDRLLIETLAVVGRADAEAFGCQPTLTRFSRPTTERERKAFGLPAAAFAVVSRTDDGCVLTTYFE